MPNGPYLSLVRCISSMNSSMDVSNHLISTCLRKPCVPQCSCRPCSWISTKWHNPRNGWFWFCRVLPTVRSGGFGFARFCQQWEVVVLVLHGFSNSGKGGFGFAWFCPDWEGVVLVLHGFAQTGKGWFWFCMADWDGVVLVLPGFSQTGKGWFWFCQVLPILKRFTRSWFCKVLPILWGRPGLLLPGFANTCKASQVFPGFANTWKACWVLVLQGFVNAGNMSFWFWNVCLYSECVPGFGFVRFHQYWEGVPCSGSTRFCQYWEGVLCSDFAKFFHDPKGMPVFVLPGFANTRKEK